MENNIKKVSQSFMKEDRINKYKLVTALWIREEYENYSDNDEELISNILDVKDRLDALPSKDLSNMNFNGTKNYESGDYYFSIDRSEEFKSVNVVIYRKLGGNENE